MRSLVVIVLCLLISQALAGQEPAWPFYKEIHDFRRQDSVAPPPEGQILLLGSSSFTLWKDVAAYFPGYRILNRAFGGSTLQDVWHYRNELIRPYKPKQIVIYCGENDFAASDTVSATTVAERFSQLFTVIRSLYPAIPVVYVSIKPSPSRRHLLARFQQANALIENWLKQQRRARFVDVYSRMLQPDGQPTAAIFSADSLHMNAAGYRIWQAALKPYLKR